MSDPTGLQPGQEQRMEPKPCPFCLTALEAWSGVHRHPDNGCFVEGKVVTRLNIEAWNTRPTADLGEDKEIEEAAFELLSRKYVQRAQQRHRDLGLQYTEAETHDLARVIAYFVANYIKQLRKTLEVIECGSKLGLATFEARVHERKGRLTWYAVNVLQDNLAACEGSAREALDQSKRQGE